MDTNPTIDMVSLFEDVLPIDLLKLWFCRDVRHATWHDVETIVNQRYVAEIRFSTKYFTYTITADEMHGESFLGCAYFDRLQQETRFLPEGLFDEEIWHEIVETINENEMICERPLPGRLF